jgi:hypothetical protein
MAVSEADRFLGLSDQDAAAYEREQQRILRESQNSQWEDSVPDQGLDIGPESETLPPVRSAQAADPVAGNAPPEELPEWTDGQDAATDPVAA